jgi:hypothetical protein
MDLGDIEAKNAVKLSRLRIFISNSQRDQYGKVKTIRIKPKLSQRKTVIVRKREPFNYASDNSKCSDNPISETSKPVFIKPGIIEEARPRKKSIHLTLVIQSKAYHKVGPKSIKIVRRAAKPDVKAALTDSETKQSKTIRNNQREKVRNRVNDQKEPTQKIPELSPILRKKRKTSFQPDLRSQVIKAPEVTLLPDGRAQPVTKESSTQSELADRAKKAADRWSDCGQIFYTGGKAYGISSNLRTICIGTQSDIDSFFQHGKAESDLNFIQLDALRRIKETRLFEARRAKEVARDSEGNDGSRQPNPKFGSRLSSTKKIARPWSNRRLRKALRR